MLELTLRSRVRAGKGRETWLVLETPVTWDPLATAAIICDMWDCHWCRGATARVEEMAPRVNELVGELRRQGALIIHAPSGTMERYSEHPARKRARSAPPVSAAPPLAAGIPLDPTREPPLPIDDADGGCDCDPLCDPGHPWTCQHRAIEVGDRDAVTDSAEAVYLLRQRRIGRVLMMGVHTNMCVLGRPFGVRQLVRQGHAVALVRDLTDSMYNSRRAPFVDHFTGTDLVIEHIEKHWCPTITSDQVLGDVPFRFAADRRPVSR